MAALNIIMWVVCLVAGLAAMALPEDGASQTTACWLSVLAFIAGVVTLLPAAGY